MQTSSPTDANKFARLGTYEALFPSHTGTAQWRLLDALLLDVKSSIYGLPEMPVTIKLQPTPNSIVLLLSVGQPPAPTSQVSTQAAAPDAPSPGGSQRLYSWEEIKNRFDAASMSASWRQRPRQPTTEEVEWFRLFWREFQNQFGLRARIDPLSLSASSGASEDSSSS